VSRGIVDLARRGEGSGRQKREEGDKGGAKAWDGHDFFPFIPSFYSMTAIGVVSSQRYSRRIVPVAVDKGSETFNSLNLK
jgi:hypothetical protein